MIILKPLCSIVADISTAVSKTNTLNYSDCNILMAAALDDTLNRKERKMVKQILRAIDRGKIQVTTI